ncbi:TIGR02270 family protein [Mitsuaria sp. 7]|uniref:TIGR02270 family protein n=1 Tax=Mitsuaria sp. 7 TaxID=1658665 RepID=UPI0009EDCA88|nr:TIGR02270 family protein [Mitsuaria sp. 7]
MALLRHLPAQAPGQVCRLVNRTTVDRHAVDCAFLWTLRDQAVDSPRYRLDHLLPLDGRVDANREGLALAGEEGWAACRQALDAGDAGEVFAAALLAFATRRADRMRQACEAGLTVKDGERALIAALAWLPPEPLAPVLARLLDADNPRLRRVALRAITCHRRDPEGALMAALASDDPEIVSAGARGLGECRLRQAVPLLRTRLESAPVRARFPIAWSLALMGEQDALPLLAATVEAAGPDAELAMAVLLRAVQLAKGRHFLSSLSAHPGTERLVIQGAGILGDPVAVPWLIARMADPVLGRLAGEAFSLITGADLEYLDLDLDAAPREAPDEEEEAEGNPPHPADRHLAMPDPARVATWWSDRASSMANGVRHLCGEPIAPASIARTLRVGYQRQRRAAAFEWALHAKDAPLFDVRAFGLSQQRALPSCN